MCSVTIGHLTEPAVILNLMSVVGVSRLLACSHVPTEIGVLTFLAALA